MAAVALEPEAIALLEQVTLDLIQIETIAACAPRRGYKAYAFPKTQCRGTDAQNSSRLPHSQKTDIFRVGIGVFLCFASK